MFTGEFNLILYDNTGIVVVEVFYGKGLYRGWDEIFSVEPSLFEEIKDRLYQAS